MPKTIGRKDVGRRVRFGVIVSQPIQRLHQLEAGGRGRGRPEAPWGHRGADPPDQGARGFEIPLAAKKLAESGRVDAVICLGAVIRGSTPHFDYVAAEVSKGIAVVALETEIPVTFGVLTTDNLEQAIERAGSKSGNKGWDAAMAAMEMVNLFKEL